MTPFRPSYDNKITKKYSAKTLQQKVENKIAMQKQLGWKDSKQQMLLCIPEGISSKEDAILLQSILPGLIELQIQTLIVGRANRDIAEEITTVIMDHTNLVHIVPDEEVELRNMYAAADASIFLHNCTGSEELHNALHYGAVPIAELNSELKDYNAIEESGNSFSVQTLTTWRLFAAIVRAKETFQFPYDFRTIQRHCMTSIAQS